MKNILDLLEKFGIKPHHLEVYEEAFTHPSYTKDLKEHENNYERLEFMGDSVVNMVVANLLYRYHPNHPQGILSKARAKLVQTEGLYSLAVEHNLAEYVRFGQSINFEMIRQSKKILENVFEAFIGAIYIDQGFDKTQSILNRLFIERVVNINLDDLTDYKTALQEAFQAEHRDAVKYIKVDEKGPPNDRIFTVTVNYNETVLGKGMGRSLKKAEQEAARVALNKKAGVNIDEGE